MKPMRIALLAPTQAGKTSHLVTLYGVLTQELNTNPDYPVEFEVLNTVQKRFLEENYTKLSVTPGYEFEPSRIIAEYACRLHVEKEGYSVASLDVILVDFPGEALIGAEDEDNKDDVEEIIKKLSECDGFIILLDADAILLGLETGGSRVSVDKMKAHNVRRIVKEAMERRRQHPIAYGPDEHAFGRGETPIVFAVTKGDKLSAAVAEDESGAAQFIEELYSNRRQTQKFTGKGIARALIQHQFADFINHQYVASMQLVTSLYREGDKEKWLSPQKIEYPFQFVLFMGILNAIDEYEARLVYWNKKVNSAFSQQLAEERRRNAAKASLDERKSMSFWSKLTQGGRRTHELEDSWQEKKSDYQAAKAIREAKEGDKERARQYQQYLLLFLENILSDKFAYLLSQGEKLQGFRQRGLPISRFANSGWWKEKIAAGESQYKEDALAKKRAREGQAA